MPSTYTGRRKKWQQDRFQAIAMHERTFATVLGPQVPDSLMRVGGIFENQLALGLYHAWTGAGGHARTLLHATVTTALDYVARGMSRLASQEAPDLAQAARRSRRDSPSAGA
jgi:hypothetical protein